MLYGPGMAKAARVLAALKRDEWVETRRSGSYRVLGTIRPLDAPAVRIDRTVEFTPAAASQLKRVTPPAAPVPTRVPGWLWPVLALTLGLLTAMSLALWKLSRRRAGSTA